MGIKFDEKKAHKLNDPGRIKWQDPDLLSTIFGDMDSKTAVELGVGTGYFAVALAKKYKKAKIVGVDISFEMIQKFKENAEANGITNVLCVKSEENDTLLRDNFADVVYLINVYHELADQRLFLMEARRILKKGGTILIIDWKAEDTPQGPPLYERIGADHIVDQLKLLKFKKISSSYEIYPYHYAIKAEK
ncbi:MAG TPA: class I SAM-dependent methyltransferase [Candidatus Wallbacteria bacterium]|nr:class I SAM-dependent methyltransferase [Candidatus Wallbacteria bacterium]